MARINPKLNLNKTPQNVEDSSLIFAKNIKLDKELSICPDSAVESIKHWVGGDNLYPNIIGKIVGVNNKIYFFAGIEDIKIYEYDELRNTIREIKTGWTYSGGEITGCVSVNNTGEEILTIAEYNSEKDIPIKHINLAQCNENDDDSVYTQAPNIPITNLNFKGYYNNTIPNGVYQFFIRYKIKDDFYTNWFPASKELFSGNTNHVNTIQGELQYVNLNRDSDESFIFTIKHLYEEYTANYTHIQIGFIISNDNGNFARSWKTLPINTSEIFFTYEESDIEEINIDDLLKSTFDLYNVHNVVFYKNKLYVSNYKESNLNDDLSDLSSKIKINLKTKSINNISDDGYYLDNKELLPKNPDSGIYTYLDNKDICDVVYGKSKYCNLNIIENVENEIVKDNDDNLIELPHTETKEKVVVRSNYPDMPVSAHKVLGVCSILGVLVKVGDDYKLVKDVTNTISSTFRWYDDDVAYYGLVGKSESCDLIKIVNTCEAFIKNSIIGLDVNGNFYFKLSDDTIAQANEYYIIYSKSTKGEIKHYHIDHGFRQYDYDAYDATKTTYIIKRRCTLNLTLLENRTNYINVHGFNTLLPFTEYKFYAHYLTQNGVITNGNYIKSLHITNYNVCYEEITKTKYDNASSGIKKDVTELPKNINNLRYYYFRIVNDILNPTEIYGYYYAMQINNINNHIIYPTFSNIIKPNNYVGVFISAIKTKNDVCNCFNHQVYDENNNYITEITTSGTYTHKVDCLELDTFLYTINDNISVYSDDGELITDEAKYVSSGDSNELNLGTAGYVTWKEEITVSGQSIPVDNYNCWIIINKNTAKDINNNLIKITQYIKLENDDEVYSLDDYENDNSQGYLCKVEKPQRFVNSGDQLNTNKGADSIFVSGNDIFSKNIVDNVLKLDDISGRVDLLGSDFNFILSNFNLNYLSLTELVNPQIRTYKPSEESEQERQVVKQLNSLIISNIYELQGMYKSYIRKLYTKNNDKSIITFNNTVRSSNIDVDEVYRNIYKFDASDYYNVPTNRGIIVNLFSIVNKIYVHCEHALFTFVDNSTMKVGENLYTSNSSDIALQETDPFNVGIKELFDSEYGYAGLQNKKHSLITFNSYIFYDSVAKIIYAYSGENQIVPISDSIYKILNWFEPTDIYFAADNNNDRFFINIRKATEDSLTNICLSYNFKSKSFVSIHDLDFDDSFNSRINCYFQSNKVLLENNEDVNKSFVYKVDNENNGITNYNELHKTSALRLNEVDEQANGNIVANSIDIVCNIQYEKTKTLNWINWICKEITDYVDANNITLAEENGKKYSGHYIRIYSDETYSPLISLTNDENEPLESNNVPLSVENGHYNPAIRTYPRYNCGVWSMNNFRDIKNIKGNNLVSDNMSLIYGKYFVVRFIFKQKNFKFENIKLNMGNYEKN